MYLLENSVYNSFLSNNFLTDQKFIKHMVSYLTIYPHEYIYWIEKICCPMVKKKIRTHETHEKYIKIKQTDQTNI